MFHKETFFITLLLLVGLIMGCAVTPYKQGKALLDDERYDDAIGQFQIALEQEPDNPSILRELAIAHYQKKEYDKAIPSFQKALVAKPEDGKTILYLGLCYEGKEAFDEAIKTYKNYTQVGRLSRIRQTIEGRIKILIRKKIAKAAKESLANEAQLDVASIPEDTIAIAYFQYDGANEELKVVRKGLTDMLINDLANVKQLKVVERTLLQVLLEEMKLAATSVMDESTSPRVGRLLGANRIVNGAFADLADEQLRIDANVTLTKEAKLDSATDVSGKLEKFFALEKELAFKVVDSMGITLTGTEREAIQKIPTESMLAFLAFCRGLDLSDQGKYQEAAAAFSEAVQIDPNFTEASAAASDAEQLDAGSVSNETFTAMIENVTAPETDNERVVRLEQIEDDTLGEGAPRGGGESGPTPGAGPNVEVRVLIPNVEVEAEF